MSERREGGSEQERGGREDWKSAVEHDGYV